MKKIVVDSVIMNMLNVSYLTNVTIIGVGKFWIDILKKTLLENEISVKKSKTS